VHAGRVFVDLESHHSRPLAVLVPGDTAPGSDNLSERERTVLERLAQGHTNQSIAEQLNLSVKTIESYRARLLKKLGLRSRADITRYAVEMGLLGRREHQEAAVQP
jgi:DNA-binding NarL/FixJ family response regulator